MKSSRTRITRNVHTYINIDGDVRPTPRGMFVYMYACMYLAVWCVCPPSYYVPEKSRARKH